MEWGREDAFYEGMSSHTTNEKSSTSPTLGHNFDLKKRVDGINALESADFDDLAKDMSETFSDVEQKYGKRMVDDLKGRMEDKGIYISYYAPEVIQSIRYAGYSAAHDSYEFFVMDTDLKVYDTGSNSFVPMRVSAWSFVEHKTWTSVLIDGEDITPGQKAKKVKDKTTMNRTLWLFLKPARESVKKDAVEQYEANGKRRSNTWATPQDIELRTIPSSSTTVYAEVAQNKLVDLKEWEYKQVESWRTYKRVWGQLYYNSLNTDGAWWTGPDATWGSVHTAGRFLEQNGKMVQMQSLYLSVGTKSYVLYNPSMPNQLFNEHGVPLGHPVWSSDPTLFGYNDTFEGSFVISYTNNRLDLWITKSADVMKEEQRAQLKSKINQAHPNMVDTLLHHVIRGDVMLLIQWEKKEVKSRNTSTKMWDVTLFLNHQWTILFQQYIKNEDDTIILDNTSRKDLYYDLFSGDTYRYSSTPPAWQAASRDWIYRN